LEPAELELLTDTLRRTMNSATGAELDSALTELGWPELLAEAPDIAIPLVFRLFGETGAHAPLLNDVVSGSPSGTVPLPFAGGTWIIWDRTDLTSDTIDPGLPLRLVATGSDVPLAAGRRALGWWLAGASRAMLTLARTHALQRTQFGRPIVAFQAVRHKLAETLVAIEGAEATLAAATDELGSLLAKAAAGQAARTAARHCQQVLGGIGFTTEHDLHRHIRRVLILDSLLGSARELTREAGVLLRAEGRAPRLVQL
jgi:hypothetical protein